jgi:hypothetical protein
VYFLTGKNVSEQRGWSVVTEDGEVCCTISGGMGLLAARTLCESLNKNLGKRPTPIDPAAICLLNYDDNKIVWDEVNQCILKALVFNDRTFDDLVRFFDVDFSEPQDVSIIDKALKNLISEGWISHSDENSTHSYIPADHYQITLMGRLKTEWLMGVTNEPAYFDNPPAP